MSAYVRCGSEADGRLWVGSGHPGYVTMGSHAPASFGDSPMKIRKHSSAYSFLLLVACAGACAAGWLFWEWTSPSPSAAASAVPALLLIAGIASIVVLRRVRRDDET